MQKNDCNVTTYQWVYIFFPNVDFPIHHNSNYIQEINIWDYDGDTLSKGYPGPRPRGLGIIHEVDNVGIILFGKLTCQDWCIQD